MEYSTSSLLNVSPYFCHGKMSLEESWLCTSVELESLKMQADEEIRRRDEQLSHVKELLYKAMKERDEALQKCQTLHVETLILQQQQQLLHNTQMQHQQQQQVKDEPVKELDANLSSSDCDESILSSPVSSKLQSFQEQVMEKLLPDNNSNNRPLPEKGKLLQAVMNAGPLLQTLLLAGPLPQWRHPPPPLESFEIPPVTINCNNRISRKRGLSTSTDCSDSSTESHKVHNFASF
ncbi:unnamed protein product [Rhodiola kirilowii]